MSVNPDSSKQAQKMIFSRKTKKVFYPSLRFSNSIFSQTPYQKHLGIFLDAWLTFEELLKVITTKVNKTVGLLQKLQKTLSSPILMTVHKYFMRPHLEYGDVICDEAYNETFHQKLESIQYNTWVAVSGAIRGSSRENFYRELDLESLKRRRWYSKPCLSIRFSKKINQFILSI